MTLLADGGETEIVDEDAPPYVNVVFIGPCGCGKSTTAGHLIADCGAIEQASLERIAQEAAAAGHEERSYAWILDKLRCERERGGTAYAGLWRIASQRCRFTVIDAPGHADFVKDTVTAMSQAEIAVLVVSGDPCELGTYSGSSEVHEHALLAYTLGLHQIVVCVNKLDNDGVAYSQDLFENACRLVRDDLRSVGLKAHDVHFVPTSGWIGDNLAFRSANTPWYCGPTLLEALDDTVAVHFMPERPLRLPLHGAMQIGGSGVVGVGRVATGSLRRGMQVVLAPRGVRSEVLAVMKHREEIREAHCGDSVNVVLDVALADLRRGTVASSADDCPARECSSFLAQVIVLEPPREGAIAAGCVLLVECHAAQVMCYFEELLSRADRRTGEVLDIEPVSLQVGDAAVVRLRPVTPLCVEPFDDYPPLGRFAVRDQKTTVAVGVVQQVEYRSSSPPAPAARPSRPVSATNREGHRSRHSAVKGKGLIGSSGGYVGEKVKVKERPQPVVASCARDSAVISGGAVVAGAGGGAEGGSLARSSRKGVSALPQRKDIDSGEDSPEPPREASALRRVGASPAAASLGIPAASPFAAFAVSRTTTAAATGGLAAPGAAPAADGAGGSTGAAAQNLSLQSPFAAFRMQPRTKAEPGSGNTRPRLDS
eukprot:TRINITY_DN19394_c1_g2_i1.p1 TRINITY_DN19394_c1_g2~~TRINITY_DN19394_c1_g2_i1.p1  ORF type:complete len:654 (-),score=155.15 TRINITY_DN19394_c1_g2_i1:75-2036(-)